MRSKNTSFSSRVSINLKFCPSFVRNWHNAKASEEISYSQKRQSLGIFSCNCLRASPTPHLKSQSSFRGFQPDCSSRTCAEPCKGRTAWLHLLGSLEGLGFDAIKDLIPVEFSIGQSCSLASFSLETPASAVR